MGWFEILKDGVSGVALTKAQDERLKLKADQIEAIEKKLVATEAELAECRAENENLKRKLTDANRTSKSLKELRDGPSLNAEALSVLTAISDAGSISHIELFQKVQLSKQVFMYHVEELLRHKLISDPNDDSDDDWIDWEEEELLDDEESETYVPTWELTQFGRKFLFERNLLK